MKKNFDMPCAMTVAGSDSGAGAGIQADLLSFAANGVYGCTAIAALTAQNPDGVFAIFASPSEMLAAQMKAVAEFYRPKAAKTGMLFNAEIVECAAEFFKAHGEIALVADPVMVATSGARLLEDDAADAVENKLFPVAKLITPNLDEAAILLKTDKISDIEFAAKKLRDKFGVSVLLKGGHMAGDDLLDCLALADGGFEAMKSKRIRGVDTHGSGCTLSAAIAANLAKGFDLKSACAAAREYLCAGMKKPVGAGGRKFINHFPESK